MTDRVMGLLIEDAERGPVAASAAPVALRRKRRWALFG
jgi:hypothetical protein